MIFTETAIRGAFIIDIEKQEDHRGFYGRAWCEKEFDAHGLTTRFVQANISFTKERGTMRGLHYQAAPHLDAKLIRCTRGAIYDVIIDLRPTSPTFKQWFAIDLTAENRRMLYVPVLFAHGFQTLEDDTEVFYPVSEVYSPECEQGIRWNDPEFGIIWPDPHNLVISDKDQSWPDYSSNGPVLTSRLHRSIIV